MVKSIKSKILISLFAFNVWFLNNNVYAQAQNNSSEKQILVMLKKFYIEYITEIEKMPLNENKVYEIKQKYCNDSLVNKLEKQQLDYDPFLKAQDSNTEWLKTLRVKRNLKAKDSYIVSYLDNYNKAKIIIKLKVSKQEGNHQIISVW